MPGVLSKVLLDLFFLQSFPIRLSLSPVHLCLVHSLRQKGRLFTVRYFSLRSSRSSASRYGQPSWLSVKTTHPRWLPLTQSARRSYGKIGDCDEANDKEDSVRVNSNTPQDLKWRYTTQSWIESATAMTIPKLIQQGNTNIHTELKKHTCLHPRSL